MAEKKKKLVVHAVPQMDPVDVNGPEYVEFLIREDGKMVWVNVDGACAFRACNVKQIVINDNRVPKIREQDAILNQDPILQRAIEDSY